ncbi:MAG: prepilin peptidase [Nitrospirota bacterium]|nr:MAG: prepilin peptidase [Nitrospirota bacterium]
MYFYIVAFIFGAVVGSFLNVCIHRIPRKRSIVFPSSRCPNCSSPIAPLDNMPILSYIILRGRCRECNEGISIRYPLVEALNAGLYVLTLWRFGPHFHTVIYMVFISAMIVITFIDLDFQIIPDVITIPGVALGAILALFVLVDPYDRTSQLGIINSGSGIIAGGGVFYAIAVLSKGGMGGGDIKMMGMVGSFLGWKGVIMTTFIGSFIGAIMGIILMVFMGKGRKAKIPFGPFLALGSLISLFAGQELLLYYLSL